MSTRLRSRTLALLPSAPLGVWLVLGVPLVYVEHYSLRTNAYDLSVFDYALWSTLEGRLAQVPFMGHSLLSHHLMPTLFVLLPVYALEPSPVALISLQLAFTGAAVLVLARLIKDRVSGWIVAGLSTAFLFSRSPYNAITGPFYIESAIPLLVFLLIWAWERERRILYWTLLLLALGCKEDMALYLGTFGLISTREPKRRVAALVTVLISAVWLLLALHVAIPDARARDGLPRANPFLETRYSSSATTPVELQMVDHLVSRRSLIKLFGVTSSVGLLCWMGPEWLGASVPGIVLNLAARRDTLQSALLGHYVWPLLPWMFLAAAAGAARVLRRWPRAHILLVAILFTAPLLDTPLWLDLVRRPWAQLAEARRVREQLSRVRAEGTVLAQANLIPHLPHAATVSAVGRELPLRPAPDFVFLSEVGNLWPLDAEGVRARIQQYRRDARYKTVCDGPLWAFRKRSRPRPLTGPA